MIAIRRMASSVRPSIRKARATFTLACAKSSPGWRLHRSAIATAVGNCDPPNGAASCPSPASPIAYRPGLFGLTLDPDNPQFATCISDGTLRRQVAHEVHHCLRMAGPGYGRVLGEALVSEGLAGHFTRRLLGIRRNRGSVP